MKKLIAVVALITLVVVAQAQTKDGEKDRHSVLKYPKVKTNKKKKLGNQLMQQGSYYNAAEYFEDVLKDKPDNIKVIHNLALINESLRDYKTAEKYYKLELDKDPKKWPNDRFYLGQVQKMNGKYDDAKKSFQEYL